MYIQHWLATLIRDEEGLVTVEYAVLLAGLTVGSAGMWQVIVSAMTTPTDQAAQIVNSN